ncbi:hypothetical protein ABC347_12920 [Sphingomonas sp. 1P06PA]|uniref:hypothetical protein n=1 Tax=Sphingomonas sp. 1P06PA TaxID=554121 RepID=UPI0039A705B1
MTITPPAPVTAAAEPATTVAPAAASVASTTTPRTTATGGGLDGLNVPAVTVDLGTADATPVEEVAPVAAAPVAARPAARSATVAASTAPAAAPSMPAPTPIADAAPTAAVDAPPVAQANAEPAVVPAAAAAPVADAGNDLAPLAGAAGLGALLIAGGAVAYGRRRRSSEQFVESDRFEDSATIQVVDKPAAPVAAAPAYVAPRAPVAASAAPAGFDTARFSPRVQAAYAGPTADNPSQSLKARLKRARFFDQRERIGAPVATDAARTASPEAKSRYGEFAMGRGAGPKPGFRPAYQN